MAISKGTFVAYAGADGSATSVAATSFDSTGSGLLIAAAGWEDVDSSGLNFTDNKGNTWQTAVVEQAGVDGNSPRCAIGWCVPTTAASGHVITCNFGASVPFRRICVLPVNGSFSASDALIATTQQLTGTAAVSTGLCDLGTLTTSVTALLVMAMIDYHGETATVGTDGWTKDSATAGRHFQSQVKTGGATVDPSMAISVGVQFAGIAMAFKETSGGGSSGNPWYAYAQMQ